jgi:para-nitrobenzyl esterase
MRPARVVSPLALALALGACSDPAPAPVDAAVPSDTAAVPDAPTGDVSTAPEGPTATTPSGTLRGVAGDGVTAFLGVPYAAPPVGDLRWRAPAPFAPWQGVRDATAKGPACPQSRGTLLGSAPTSEDCLTLNVWTPSGAPGSTQRLPVMVFVHGGGFTAGTVAGREYDGDALARRGVVLVNFNYRLGQLGFLAHPALAAEDSTHRSAGNYGLLDQQAALRWVQTHIASLGGDPNNVTLFGESAGSISVCAQMASPLARGLFHKAISQSGPCSFVLTPQRDIPAAPMLQSAESLALRFAREAGCEATPTAACLRALPVDRVLTAAPTPVELTRFGARYQPNIDGHVLPEMPWVSFLAGRVARVPFLSGTNRDEGTFFTFSAPVATEAAYRAAVEALVPGHAAEVVERLYPPSAHGNSANAAFTAFLGDAVFVCPARAQARLVAAAGSPAWLYHFTRLNRAGTALGLGVFHTAELPYVFDNFVGIFSRTAADVPVMEAMQGYWTRFAATGDPNGAGAVTWPRFTRDGDTHLEIGDAVRASTGLRRDVCDTLERWIVPDAS